MPISLPSGIVRNVAPAAEPASLAQARTLRTAAPERQTPEAFVKFEAMVLQTFMQSILPRDSESVYGGGMAGDMWKSMLAQQLGEVMARRGGIGIADRVLGDHYRHGEDKVPLAGVSPGPHGQSANHQDVPPALVEKMQREVAVSADLAAAAASRKP